MSSTVSLTDVARVAGVDRSTVSRVLAGKAARGRICPATQARIRSAASQLGYVRKPAIRFSLPVVVPPESPPVAEPPRLSETSAASERHIWLDQSQYR